MTDLPTPDGFEYCSTGGGYYAWFIQKDGFYVWITDGFGDDAPSSQCDYVMVGFYLEDEQLEFKDGEPPIIPELHKLITDKNDLNDWNNTDFVYGIDTQKATLADIISIVRTISKDTFNKEVVLGHNNEGKK